MKRSINVKKLIIEVLLLVILGGVIFSIPYLEERAIMNTVNSLGKAIQEGQIEKVNRIFVPDAIFMHKEHQCSYENALKVLDEKIKKGIFYGTLYVSKIKEKTKENVLVLNIAWFKIDNKSYEASGTIELQKVGLWQWKIKKISSETWAFGNVFFGED